MKPRVEKITKPAKTLVPQLINEIIMASLIIKTTHHTLDKTAIRKPICTREKAVYLGKFSIITNA